MSVSIRISRETHERLLELASARQQPIGRVVAEAVNRLISDQFWDEMEAAFEQLYGDADATSDYETELRAWDVTLLDGLDCDPPKKC